MGEVKTYSEDECCDGCGITHEAAREQGEIFEGELLQRLECPGCGKVGCNVCMPAGNGCLCPECEDDDE